MENEIAKEATVEAAKSRKEFVKREDLEKLAKYATEANQAKKHLSDSEEKLKLYQEILIERYDLGVEDSVDFKTGAIKRGENPAGNP